MAACFRARRRQLGAAARRFTHGARHPYQGGVPFYLLIVGSPDRIPFEFQALLKMQWAVGPSSFRRN